MFGFTVLLLAVVIARFAHHLPSAAAFPFVDESLKRGLEYLPQPRKKYGGPTVVDLDEDGWPDLLFSHHGGNIELYFNRQNGYFEKSSFRLYRDCHGINAFRLSTFIKGKHFVISRGGSNGNKLAPPDFFHVTPDRRVLNVTEHMNARSFAGRCRTMLAINLKPVTARVDAIFINRDSVDQTDGPTHFFSRGVNTQDGPTFKPQKMRGAPFDKISTELVTATDIDGDGKMEIITYPFLKMYSQNKLFLTDITDKVFRNFTGPMSRVITVAEFDYDNDGDMDLFVGRANIGGAVGYGKGYRPTGVPDTLFENVGTHYVDVTSKAKIPRGPSQTRGVTTADFNNDGHLDILIVYWDQPDIILFSNGDGTFHQHEAGFDKPDNTVGDNAVAVDFDKDGKIDVVLSQGLWSDRSRGGEYRLMHNVGVTANYLAVRIGSSPLRKCTSLHALVHVYVGGVVMTRRVGSPGSVVSHSLLENLHFGIGNRRSVDSVNVTWIDGSTESKANVAANQEISFGVNRL